jgi:hypothetical protein
MWWQLVHSGCDCCLMIGAEPTPLALSMRGFTTVEEEEVARCPVDGERPDTEPGTNSQGKFERLSNNKKCCGIGSVYPKDKTLVAFNKISYSVIFFNAFILWNNEAVVHYCDL